MSKAWRVIMVIVMIALILGAVCIGVGLLTGAETGRIYMVLDNRFELGAKYSVLGPYFNDELIPYVRECGAIIRDGIVGIFR